MTDVMGDGGADVQDDAAEAREKSEGDLDSVETDILTTGSCSLTSLDMVGQEYYCDCD